MLHSISKARAHILCIQSAIAPDDYFTSLDWLTLTLTLKYIYIYIYICDNFRTAADSCNSQVQALLPEYNN